MKVGDYIHYKYSNYLKYGISIDKNQSVDPNSIFNQQREIVLNQLKKYSGQEQKNIKNQLEQQINFFFKPSMMQIMTGYSDQEAEQIQQQLIYIVEKVIKEMHPAVFTKAVANYTNLSAKAGTGSITLENGVTETWAKIRKAADFNKKGQTATTAGALDRRVKQLIQQRNKIQQDLAKASQADLKFVEGVNALELNFKSLIQEVNNLVVAKKASIGGVNNSSIVHAKKMLFASDLNNENVGNFASAIQELIDMTRHISNTELTGALGETIPVVSQWAWEQFQGKTADEVLHLLDNLNLKMTIDVIKGKIVGKEQSIKTVLSSKVISKKDSNNIQAQIGDIKLNTTATQDKVDIMLSMPDRKPFGASVKNVNLNSGFDISILKGSNVIIYIQDYSDFANHYLNVTANANRSSDRAPGYLIKQAHETLRLTIALHALTGGLWGADKNGNVFKTKQAELFIVNDNSKAGNFKVYFMSDLINKLSNNMDYLKIEPNFDTPKVYNNKWIGDSSKDIKKAWVRISKILGELRTQQLIVSISPKILVDK